MKECEIKILNIDVAAIRSQLTEVGAELLFSGEMEVRYFDFEDGRIKDANELLRVRRLGEKVELVNKQNLRVEDGMKIADEFEVVVSDFEMMTTILKNLGFVVAKEYKRVRHHYVKDGVHLVIDEYPGLDPYMEIEAQTAYGIEEWIMDLGLQEKERSTKTFDQLLEEAGI